MRVAYKKSLSLALITFR